MLLLFDALEADFLRDYGIDLVKALPEMTWRRFLVLTHNLSPYGAAAMRLQEMTERAPKGEAAEKRAAERFFTSVTSV